MLDHYLDQNVSRGSNLFFYCDNAPGQNKNCDLIAYFTFLVKIAKGYQTIEVYFMIAGHTKFSPDGNFGYISKANCYSTLNLVGQNGCIQKSSVNNIDMTYKDPLTSELNFQWYDWQKFLRSKFKACNGIQKWHVIKVAEEGDHIQVADDLGTPLKPYQIVTNIPLDEGPDVLSPEFFRANRKIELEFFKDFVLEEHQDFISPVY